MMDQPSMAELVSAVREFIEKHALPELVGRTGFHARVAANALAIVERELALGGSAQQHEAARLRDLLGQDGAIDDLNRELCRRIRSGGIDIGYARLERHLIETTLSKVAIDQPGYSGLVHSPHRPPASPVTPEPHR